MQWCGLLRPRRLSSVYRGRETSQDIPDERGKTGDTAWLGQRRESERQTLHQALSGEGCVSLGALDDWLLPSLPVPGSGQRAGLLTMAVPEQCGKWLAGYPLVVAE